MMSIDRRRFLTAAAVALPAINVLRAQPPASPGRIERVHSPQNLETNFAGLSDFITPNDLFYVRNHFAQPKIDLDKWKLKVEGAVDRPLELSLGEIKKLGETLRPLTLECAGNGRIYLVPQAKGVGWQNGAVSTAEWAGVSLAAVLDRAGVKDSAVEVVLEGADSGVIADPASPGAIAFARSLPLKKARAAEVMVAWGMNGKDLPPEHGAPLRAVVGGWYGMASVKWLSRLVVVTKPFQGFFQSLDYTYFRREGGLPTITPVTELQVKSQIARPTAQEIVPAGKSLKIVGAAWTGTGDIAKVEVSTDGGKTWAEANQTAGIGAPACWRLWEYEWKAPPRGKAKLMARATDSYGHTQPMDRDADRRNYMISHVIPIEIEVR
jgi:DMSO/TMAO reductase YedYZ molybdopterin-dependent catalytic subunit